MRSEFVEIAPAVADALATGRPVVALETAIVTHGLPRPDNGETARQMEQAVREAGAVPATIGLLDGRLRVGMDEGSLARLAAVPDPEKCSTRDLARVLAAGAAGGTTVAAMVHVAHQCGIRFAATGGIGGVHRGGHRSLDVSADLYELARCPVTVVCAGPKAILDLPRTLEVLESLGVAVLGFRTSDLPGFYMHDTGLPIPALADEAAFARLWHAHESLGCRSGLVVAQRPASDLAFAREEFAPLLEACLAEARALDVRGAKETPFLLSHLARLTGGRTIALNRALAVANAELAARLAATVAESGRSST